MRKVMDSLSKDNKREAALIKRYGSLEGYKKAAKEWGRKGGLTGGNGLQMLTSEQKSDAGKKGHKAMIDKILGERK